LRFLCFLAPCIESLCVLSLWVLDINGFLFLFCLNFFSLYMYDQGLVRFLI
jgi:hypothetical protein